LARPVKWNNLQSEPAIESGEQILQITNVKPWRWIGDNEGGVEREVSAYHFFSPSPPQMYSAPQHMFAVSVAQESFQILLKSCKLKESVKFEVNQRAGQPCVLSGMELPMLRFHRQWTVRYKWP